MSVRFYKALLKSSTEHTGPVLFCARSQADAEAIIEDLLDISSASWVELTEDGISVTPTSSRFNQPATDEGVWQEYALLRMRAGSPGTLHRLMVRCVRPSYVSLETRRTTVNPFRDLSKIVTVEDVPYSVFQDAAYSRTNKD